MKLIIWETSHFRHSNNIQVATCKIFRWKHSKKKQLVSWLDPNFSFARQIFTCRIGFTSKIAHPKKLVRWTEFSQACKNYIILWANTCFVLVHLCDIETSVEKFIAKQLLCKFCKSHLKKPKMESFFTKFYEISPKSCCT